MNKFSLTLIVLLALFSACQPDKPELPEGDTSRNKLNTYQPLSEGSTWTYRLETDTDIDTVVHTMTGKSKEFNKKVYFAVDAQSGTDTPDEGYYYNLNHIYSIREDNPYIGSPIEITYLNDIAETGYTWTNTITDEGLLNGVPAKMVGKIVERNIIKSVLGKSYGSVIHTKVELQYNLTGNFETMATYDFFVAKKVGIIEIDTDFGGLDVSTTQLMEHQIKK